MAEQPRKQGRNGRGAARLKVLTGGEPTPEPSYRLLTQVSAALSTSLDLDVTLKEILERLNSLMAFDAATIFLLDADRRELQVKAALGVPVGLREVKRFKVGEGVVGWVVQHGSTALIENSTRDARYKPNEVERSPKTVLACPLRAQDLVLGALVLVRSAREPFGPDHQRLVEAVASQAAVAIDHARLFETERASRRRAEALLATAQACSEAVTMPELLQRAVKQVAFAMRATGAAIVLPDEQGKTIEAAFDTYAPAAAPLQPLLRQPIDNFALGTALREASRPLLLQPSDPRPLLPDLVWSRIEANALVAAPIRWQGRLLAALMIGFASRELADTDLELLEEISRQVALGMERLRLQGRVQEQQNQMAVVAERNRIARDMHDGIVQYVYALGLKLEHARDLAGTEPDAVPPVLTSAIEQTNHVLSEMRTFIYQLRPIIMKEKEIGQWVADLCRQFQQATGVQVAAQIGETGGRELAPEISIALFRIIQEALSNIYQHAHATHAVLSLAFGGDGVSLSIEDDGQGFIESDQPEPNIERGQGLGNMKERVLDLGGNLELKSAPGQGTRLEAVFPYSR
jgi:signal transduction histidine kinase/putative methionine-R-sulfoxide reductase with GAF domain